MKVQETLRFGGANDIESRKEWLAERWNLFSGHREKVMQILSALAGTSSASVAVWGAGACADIDLVRLSACYEKITLLDIDGELLDYAPLLQPRVDYNHIQFLGGIDLTGLYNELEQWKVMPPDVDAIEKALDKVAGYRLAIEETYNVVCSGGVFSQIVNSIAQSLGKEHPRLVEAIQRVRDRHFELMLEHTEPGGYAVFITDMVSSVTALGLLEVTESELTLLLEKLIKENNFFTACNPYAIVSAIQQHEALLKKVEKIEMTKPWLWQMNNNRVHLVYALIIKKTDPAVDV